MGTQNNEYFEISASEAFQKLAEAVVGITREQAIARDLLQKLLDERKQMIELLEGFDLRLKSMMGLVDFHRATLEKAGLMSPMPKEAPGVN